MDKFNDTPTFKAPDTEQKSSREYKNTFFQRLFHESERAIELLNALEQTDYPKNELVKFYTRGHGSISRRNNDLTFIIADQILSIQDHQSTINPNMPLRFLSTVGDILFAWLQDKRALYKSKLITIPTPKFYVLYNGKEPLKDDILRLSDGFRYDNHDFSLELEVKVVDINYNNKSELLRRSPSLEGYSYLIGQIRTYMECGCTRDKAIKAAANECIEKGILADFLQNNFMEVLSMYDWEVTLEEEIEILVEEGMEKGLEKGLEKGREECLASIPDILKALKANTPISEISERFKVSEKYIEQFKLAM